MSEIPRLLCRRREAAEFLGMSESAFTRRVAEGTVPAPIQIGGAIRWRLMELRAWRKTPEADIPKRERRPKSVPLGPNVCHLYRHFDAEGRLLYVGISLSAVARLADHKQESAWFWQIARIEVTAYATKAAALKAERISIQREKPLHNIVHARRAA